MLPERLCNFICSLRPNEEKLAFSVIFDITEKGEVRDSRIVHTVINSDRRFTYEEAQQIIETKEGDFKEEVLTLDTIAKALREKRFSAGAINFDRYEVKFEIDEKGKPISVYFKESKDANKLVEEFMLLANNHQLAAVPAHQWFAPRHLDMAYPQAGFGFSGRGKRLCSRPEVLRQALSEIVERADGRHSFS